jgi:hypothetical protein
MNYIVDAFINQRAFSMNEISIDQITPWIKRALDRIPAEKIKNCFKRCIPTSKKLGMNLQEPDDNETISVESQEDTDGYKDLAIPMVRNRRDYRGSVCFCRPSR